MDRRRLLQSLTAFGVLPAVGCQRSSDTSADGFTLNQFSTNGIRVRAAVEGTGPLVIMVHGFPELWYSWRHQIGAIADAGFRVVAPDVRGYGGSDKPAAIDAYTMRELTADVVGLIDSLGEDRAILVGHDWGAPIVWNTAFLYPDRVAAVAGLSVPALRRGDVSPIELYEALYADRFFYQLYFQMPGVAEAEFEADAHAALRKIFYLASGDFPQELRDGMLNKPRDADMLSDVPDPEVLPEWIDERELDYFAEAFAAGGFRGPLNRYRAQQRDWETMPELSGLVIDQPSCFIAGSRDVVRNFVPGVDLYATAGQFCADFRGSTIIDGEGHWIQQEAPDTVNRALLEFLTGL